MADIDVERKGPSIWPWILGLLVLALLVWLLVEWLGDDDDVVDQPVATVVDDTLGAAAAPVTAPVGATAAGGQQMQQYMTTCAPAQPQEMGLQHEYTANCIELLAGNVESISAQAQGVNVQSELDRARQNAQQLRQSAADTTVHARLTSEALSSLATAIDRVQEAQYPNMGGQVDQLQQTVQNVEASGTLLDQREPVQNFFRQAGDVLNSMAGAGAGTATTP